jgi:hypothetical protein
MRSNIFGLIIIACLAIRSATIIIIIFADVIIITIIIIVITNRRVRGSAFYATISKSYRRMNRCAVSA